MRKPMRSLAVGFCLLVAGVAHSSTGGKYDGLWTTRLICPVLRHAAGFMVTIPSVVRNGHLRGDYGTAGKLGYILIEGPIADDGSATLTVKGVAASSSRSGSAFDDPVEDYSYEVDAQFDADKGTGKRAAGTDSLGRRYTFVFNRLDEANMPGVR